MPATTDTPALRKDRGAFFTPKVIADFLARFAIRDVSARVMDPTCGEAVFLLAAAERLEQKGASPKSIGPQLAGFDIHEPSLRESDSLLSEGGWPGAKLRHADFFAAPTPDQLTDDLGWFDAVIGNPPFVRYQDHRGDSRDQAMAAAAAQGVKLSGLASSWAPALVHAAGFLRPEGRLAMVLPAELLTVHYAEPVRRWLRQRFASVTLVMFEQLQFDDAEAQVVLLLAQGRGHCDSFVLHHVSDADDLAELVAADGVSATPAEHGKWTDMSMAHDARELFRSLHSEQMVSLSTYGQPELGMVTGANDYFALSESERRANRISESHLRKISPPGTKHLVGTAFTPADWQEAKGRGDRVWLFSPKADSKAVDVARYVAKGEEAGVHLGYKCSIRKPWWRPPEGIAPDLFFTYMSHRYPRLITNEAGVQFLNSMHGIKLREDAPEEAKQALPLLALNSATMLGAETMGRSYGGGILKMEPREAAQLPVPGFEDLAKAWHTLKRRRAGLEWALTEGHWASVVGEIDKVLLHQTMGIDTESIDSLREWATVYRVRRTRQTEAGGGEGTQTRRAGRTRPATGSSRPQRNAVGSRRR